ncbi:hypothetical protein EJ110_NYTH55245 [Nymphaea thermarum]|nr:hypothetical protein EJ110_NYTH55245 [Nymphaea thermarum]
MSDSRVTDSSYKNGGRLPENLQPAEEIDELENSPIEQVRLTVPATDDPTLPVLTFRTWTLGLFSCALLAFLNQFFGYRQNQLSVSSISAQIIALPLGKLMAATLPAKVVRIPGTKWEFSLNSGPFNIKEHVLITIFANSGSNSVYAVNIITIVKAFYHRQLHPMAAFLLSQTTQMMGYGWAGLFRKYLVDSPYMWWPANLVQVSLFRALHEEEVRRKRGTTRLQFFLMVFVASYCYYIVPNYLFPSITALSFVCWIWKDSVTAQQIGSGLSGLGLGSIGLDWSTVARFLGSPLATPGFAVLNVMAGFFLVVYVMLGCSPSPTGPTFTMQRASLSSHPMSSISGANPTTSSGYLIRRRISFATLAATISHVALFHGKSRQTKQTFSDHVGDVHTRLMKKNYVAVPEWWFSIILICVVGLAFLACLGFGGQLQLPWWGILLACAVAFFFTLPIGIIQATTNQQPGLNVITELIIGYLYPGRPLANVAFKTYGYISMSQALMFLSDFKLGHYMKIPPRSMFVVQLVGTLLSSSVYFGTAWWLLSTVPNICDTALLDRSSPWTCPGDDVFYNASIIWGVVGPLRMFGRLGVYPEQNWWFLVGLLAPVPVWVCSRLFPKAKWISLINMPVLIGATSMMPQAKAVNYLSWGAVGIAFNFVVYRKYKQWWARHNYVLSAGLDAGVAFSAVLTYFALQYRSIFGIQWWGTELDDHCALARCPTEPGMVTKGCPVF